MKANRVLRLGALALVVSLMTSGMMGTTLAKYADEVTGTGTVAVAKWNVTLNAPSPKEFTLAGTKVTNDKVGSAVVAPGDKGELGFSITDAGTDTAYKYSISIDNKALTDAGVNIKFYSDDTYSTEWVNVKDQEVPLDSATQKTKPTTNTGKIYWKWVEDNNTTSGKTHNKDTLAGMTGAADLKFTVTLTAEQLLSTTP